MVQIEFPEMYTKKNHYVSHKNKTFKRFYDVNAFLMDGYWWRQVLEMFSSGTSLYPYNATTVTCVGIATGGAVIARAFMDCAMIKDGELKGDVGDTYILVDDVCTTEKSIKDAIKIIGREPEDIFVVVDRRKKKTLKIRSLFKGDVE